MHSIKYDSPVVRMGREASDGYCLYIILSVQLLMGRPLNIVEKLSTCKVSQRPEHPHCPGRKSMEVEEGFECVLRTLVCFSSQ